MKTMSVGVIAIAAFLSAPLAHAQTVVTPPQSTLNTAWEPYKGRKRTPSVDQRLDDPVLRGAIDIHIHFGPDTYPRQWDAFEIAKAAKAHGMRGMVIKSHWSESASVAYLVRQYQTPDLEVFGGLVLNTTVGGVNPQAVRYFAEIKGHYGKVVWMPTHDAEHEVNYKKETRPFVRVSEAGVLLPDVLTVLDIIAEYDLTLATGHVTPQEMLSIVAEAKARGVKRIIVTHPNLGPQFTTASVDELQRAVAMGGYVEVVSNVLNKANRAEIIAMIKALGPEHIIIGTDSGLVGSPNQTDALVITARALRQEGFSEPDLDLMFKTNPARVLGLAPSP